MIVNFYATLRSVVGAKTANFPLPEGTTVRELLNEVIRCHPGLKHELFNEQGELYQHVHVFVGGRDAPFLESGLDTPLPADETLGIFPAVGGG
jgi:molybdopterin synthase sulfur carrier subunit